jgi:primosomal protein N' (replication factor Y)
VTKILRIALPVPLRRLFDYLLPEVFDSARLIRGVRVRVPFQSRQLVGLLMEVADTSSIPLSKLKTVIEVLDETPLLPDDIMQLGTWAAEYYHYSAGEILLSAMPKALRQGKILDDQVIILANKKTEENLPILNPAQEQAVAHIIQHQTNFSSFLLDGVTGSGKTEVYLRIIDNIIKNNKQVLVMVPEISLTPQTIKRFRARFSEPIFAFHSSMTEKNRQHSWVAAASGTAAIIIGTRSAVFMPFKQLGLIIVDEEHDTSFKQQDRFRYHGRDLAVMRAHLNHIPILLGSATPSLESLLNVERKRYQYLSLPTRAGNALLPNFNLIDMRKTPAEAGLSLSLLASIREHIDAGNQVILFLNRRGFAPVLYCIHCAWMATCKRCAARMVYHQPHHLKCHHCDAHRSLPTSCESCNGSNLRALGLGTQRLENSLKEHFPSLSILRIDRDSTSKKNEMQKIFEQIHSGKPAILLGTQMLAKGHHFPHVTLVGMIDGDGGLFSADFRAIEQMGQLLLQVGGRAGRAEKPGTVMIQTHHPDHPLLQILLKEGYQAFARLLLIEREKFFLPPYVHFAIFRAEARSEKRANDFLEMIKANFTQNAVTILGPSAALLAKRKGLYCHQLLIKAEKRLQLQQFLKTIVQHIETKPLKFSVKWSLDIDPVVVL